MLRRCNRTGLHPGLPDMGRTTTAPERGGRTARAPGDPVRGHPWRTAASLAVLAGLLGGCASFSPDAGLSVAGDYASLELRKDIVKGMTRGSRHPRKRR